MKKYILAIVALAILVLPQFSLFAQNAGFVPGDIWYSKDPFEEGDKIKIYTVLFNPDIRDFTGTVRFFDKNTLLGKKNFKIPPKQIKDISIDWTVTVGKHEIYAEIQNAEYISTSGKTEKITLSATKTEESERTVSKKIVAKESEGEGGENDSPYQAIERLEEFIADKTPDLIANPVVAAATGIEGFRTSVGENSTMQKAKIAEELKNDKPSESEARLNRPMKHIKSFFHTLVSLIFNNAIVFYGLILVILFFIGKFMWRRIFG